MQDKNVICFVRKKGNESDFKNISTKNFSSLSQDGSSQLADWIANRNDFYEFINTSEEKIQDLFVQNKKTKQRIIHKLVEDFLNRIVKKKQI